MKISEMIAKLEAVKNEHGDIDVQSNNAAGDRYSIVKFDIAYVKTLSGRETKPSFWHSYYDETKRGDKVVRI